MLDLGRALRYQEIILQRRQSLVGQKLRPTVIRLGALRKDLDQNRRVDRNIAFFLQCLRRPADHSDVRIEESRARQIRNLA